MKTIKLILTVIPTLLITSFYSYVALPYGWDKWMNSQNYSSGQFGQFVCFTPLFVLAFCIYVQIMLADAFKKRITK